MSNKLGNNIAVKVGVDEFEPSTLETNFVLTNFNFNFQFYCENKKCGCLSICGLFGLQANVQPTNPLTDDNIFVMLWFVHVQQWIRNRSTLIKRNAISSSTQQTA